MTRAALAEASVPSRPVSAGFIAALALAQVGAFLSFTPLLAILAPLKAAEIDPAGKAALMSAVSFWGAAVAGLSNIAAGMLSDRTLSRFGRRRPWLALGLTGTALSYFVIMAADAAAELIFGALLFQLCLNLLFGPLVALLADRVPDAQKGRAAAFLGLAPPIGALAGAALAGLVLPGEGVRYGVIAGLLVAATLPLLAAREPPTGEGLFALARGPSRAAGLRRTFSRDFALAWASRLLMQLAITVVMIFSLFSLQDRVTPPAALAPEALLSLLMVGASLVQIAAGLCAGYLSDRLSRRKPFVLAAGLLLGAATLLMALFPDWRALSLAFVLYGAGFGLYTTVDLALVAQVLPSARDCGRDLGLINLANTLPQMLAPLLGLWLLGGGGGYQGLFLAAAAAATAGGLVVLKVRSVP